MECEVLKMRKLAKILIIISSIIVFSAGIATLLNYYNKNIKKHYFTVN